MSKKEREYLEQSLQDQFNKNAKKSAPWREILKSVPVWAVIICGCGNSYGFTLFVFQLPAYMKNTLGLSLTNVRISFEYFYYIIV